MPMKEQTINQKAVQGYDISGTWNLLTDHSGASHPILKAEWHNGVFMLNKTVELVLVEFDEFKSLDPSLMIHGKMDGNTMKFEQLSNNQLITLEYRR